jgi:CBS domain-containing protein
MQVQKILEEKNIQKVVTIQSDASIQSALTLLKEQQIGAVVVMDQSDKLTGILSERDIVRALVKASSDFFEQPVSTIMTKSVQTCQLTDRSYDILNKMTNGRFRHIPVMNDGELYGIISIGDVVKARLFEVEQENKALTDIITTA